jgi:hypothetical protein
MANVLQDYFSRMNALNRQRGMTGNMQYGRSLDPSIAEGYFDSYQKNKLQSQALANQKRGLDIQEKGVDADISYKEWSKGFQERGQEAQIEYNLKMLGFRGEELANMRDYQMAQIALGNRNAAAQEKYWGESTDIARENSAIDRMYKQGMLSNQAEATAAQRDAAKATLWSGGITGALTAGGTALGIWQKMKDSDRADREFKANMRARDRNEDGSPISPAAASNDAYGDPQLMPGAWSGYSDYQWSPTFMDYPAMSPSYAGYNYPIYYPGQYYGMGSQLYSPGFEPGSSAVQGNWFDPNYFVSSIFFSPTTDFGSYWSSGSDWYGGY